MNIYFDTLAGHGTSLSWYDKEAAKESFSARTNKAFQNNENNSENE